MSNALLAILAQTQTTTAPALPEVMGPMLPFLSAGICALIVWVVLRLIRPEKFWLRRTPGRQNQLNPLHVLVLFLIYMAAGQMLVRIVTGQWQPPSPWPDAMQTPLLLVTIGTQFILLACSLGVASMTFRHGVGRGMGLTDRHFLTDCGRGIAAGFIALPMCVGLGALMTWLMPGQPLHRMLEIVKTADTGRFALIVVSAVVVAPLAEEVFFRGMLQSMFRKYLGGPWLAILATGVLFSITHEVARDWPALFALSVVLGYNYERTGRLTSNVLAHAIFNAIMLYAQRVG